MAEEVPKGSLRHGTEVMLCTRYRNALARLIEKIGHKWLGKHPPNSAEELYQMREEVITLSP